MSPMELTHPQGEPSATPARRTAVVVSLAAPAFNEEHCIADVVRDWKRTFDAAGIAAEFVVCNDGSRDRTGAILRDLAEEVPELQVVGGPENYGYGRAMSTAISACRGQYIATLDSDGQFDPADILKFLEHIASAEADGAMGYRVKKSDTFARVLADRCLNLIVRVLFGTRLRDTNCALKVIRRERLQSLRLEATGFPLPTEICLRLEAAGGRWIECPVNHRDRLAGESKLRVWRTGWRMLWFLLYLRRQRSLYRAKILREF